MKTRRCYIYTQVSTSMQVDGYSLNMQKDKLKEYAEFQDLVIAGEYEIVSEELWQLAQKKRQQKISVP